MPAASVLRVALGERSYEITIGAGLLDRAGELLAPLLPLRRMVIVTDENLRRTPHPDRLAGGAGAGGDREPADRRARRRGHQELGRARAAGRRRAGARRRAALQRSWRWAAG